VEPEPSTKSVHVVGRYAVYDAIAAGGMATVHYGRLLGPVGFSRTVAIKRLHAQFARDPEFVSMFLDEARLAARIRHPNVVPTLDVVATEGELFLVMEYVPGESLARLVRTAAQLGQIVPPRIVMAIMCGVLRGLHAAHEATNERGEALGIVHRDVSPQNILVGIDGQARVLDFGVAKAAGRLQTTRDGQLKGKLAYMAPEQLRGKLVDRRTDIFSAATVLWEALTGRRLFRGDNEGAVITKILEGAVDPPSAAVPPEETDDATRAMLQAVDEITLKGLATRADDRYDTARAMAVALERVVPPAGVAEVSEWVEHFAKDVLVSRAQQVADIESISSVGPTSIQALRDADASDAALTTARESNPRLMPGRTSDASGARSGPVDLSTISVASQAQRTGGLPKQRLALWAMGAGACLVTGIIILAAAHSMHGDATAGAAATSASTPPTPQMPLITPLPPPTATVAAEAPPSASAAPVPAPPVKTWTPPIAHPPPRPAPPVAGPAPPPAHPTASCNPPFTYDAQGLKHFKPECL